MIGKSNMKAFNVNEALEIARRNLSAQHKISDRNKSRTKALVSIKFPDEMFPIVSNSLKMKTYKHNSLRMKHDVMRNEVKNRFHAASSTSQLIQLLWIPLCSYRNWDCYGVTLS
jgi:hypothetical protein